MRFLTALMVSFCVLIGAGHGAADGAVQLSQQEKAQVIRTLETTLRENYVHEEKTDEIVAGINQRHRAGNYRDADTADKFAELLTNDLVEISEDFHFIVIYDPAWIEAFSEEAEGSDGAVLREDEIATLKRNNFGFRKLEILEGNVGYVRFDFFPDPEKSFDAGAGAMRFIENADAIIFDMRYNRGGHNQFAQFLHSYLFDTSEPQLLHEYSYRNDGETVSGKYWSLPTLPGPRKADVPVYVLTSSTTFSAGEWFSYALQKLERAEIVGQTTSGASHAVNRKAIDDRFVLQVPVGVGRDPVDKSDFEGVGVKPDHKTLSHKARAVAHRLAIKELQSRSTLTKEDYKWMLPVLDARISTPSPDRDWLKRIEGQYEGRRIALEGDSLIYHWRDRFSLALIPLKKNLFALEGVDDFRFRFAEENGRISALERIEKDGRIIVYPRQ